MRPQISGLPMCRWHCAQLCNAPKEAEGQNAHLSLDCSLIVANLHHWHQYLFKWLEACQGASILLARHCNLS